MRRDSQEEDAQGLTPGAGNHRDNKILKESLEPETVISHYRIVSKLGTGAMGEVYLAQDTSELAEFEESESGLNC